MSLSKREMIMMILTFTLVVGAALWQFAIKPLMTQQTDLDDQIVVLQRKIAQQQAVIAQKDHINALMNKWVDVLDLDESISRQTSNTVSFIESTANQHKIHIVNISPQRETKREGVVVLPIELVIEAEWKSIIQFMKALQAKPMLMLIDDLAIEKYSDTAGSLRGRVVVSRVVAVE